MSSHEWQKHDEKPNKIDPFVEDVEYIALYNPETSGPLAEPTGRTRQARDSTVQAASNDTSLKETKVSAEKGSKMHVM